VSLTVGAYASLNPVSASGCFNFAANASATDSAEYLVVPWSAGGVPGSSTPFSLRSAVPVTAATMRAALTPNRSTRRASAMAFDHRLREMGRTRRYPLLAQAAPTTAARPSAAAAPAGPPTLGSLRTFKVCGNTNCSILNNVGARVQSVGTHIAIYQDTLAPAPGLSATDFDSLKRVFDTRLYPIDTAAFGSVSDIDNNTVVIVLMTGQVNKLVSRARCNTEGFVAGFFFPGDLDPGFATQYNNGEIFYSIVADRDSTLSCAHKASDVLLDTPVTFTHEFQHMINFVEHVLVRSANSEDGWLDEGLSKYAEELAGRSYLPGDNASFSNFAINAVYDGYQYLLAPGGSPLLIPADTGTLEEIGASWLFTRYIIDQFGDSLAGRLVQSSLAGTANVAAKTGVPFDSVVSRWSLANWVSDLPGFTAPPELKYKSWQFRGTFASLHAQLPTAFPRAYPLLPPVAGGNSVLLNGTLWSGSGDYVRVVQPPGGAAFTLQFTGGGGSPVSAAIVPRLNVVRIR
jgi:hypothetical protein